MQSGGSFDIDYSVTGPNDKIIMGNQKERQVDSVFTAKEVGEYSFCFNNEMSTWAEKMVDFEIAVGKPPSRAIPHAPTTSYCTTSPHILPTFFTDWNRSLYASASYRSRTNPPRPFFPPSKVPPRNRPPPSRNPS